MTVIDKNKIMNLIKQVAKKNPPDDFLGIYQFLRNSLNQGREKIENLPIDLIVVEDIYSSYKK